LRCTIFPAEASEVECICEHLVMSQSHFLKDARTFDDTDATAERKDGNIRRGDYYRPCQSTPDEQRLADTQVSMAPSATIAKDQGVSIS